jgi:hypothetical protein
MDEILIIQKEKFGELLKKTIEKGKIIVDSTKQINSIDLVEEIEKDYELWDDYNFTFLKSSCLDDKNEMVDIYNERIDQVKMNLLINYPLHTSESILQGIIEKTDRKCHNLKKIENRIQFYNENDQQEYVGLELFPIELLENTRGYIENIGRQIILCYNHKLFDACLVMIRKLIETLIIECFEKYKLESKIIDKNNNHYFLNELITKLTEEKSWKLTRNSKQALPNIKKYGDLSAHNRRFNAKKQDLDSLKDDLRIVIEEFISIINY